MVAHVSPRSSTSAVVADGFAFTECPRWRDGRLWFSDQHGRRVYTLGFDQPGGDIVVRDVLAVPGRPSGLGWSPAGELAVVSMDDHRLLKWDGAGLESVADLSAWQNGPANDMAVDGNGRAYVGNIGFDYDGGAEPAPTDLLMVDLAGGAVSVAAEDMLTPNGTVITPDGRELIIAESFRHRLTRFTVAPDGTLGGREVFADLGELVPDGICLDAEGAVWFAAIGAGAFRVDRHGAITDHVRSDRDAVYACALGGAGGRELFLCTSDTAEPAAALATRRSAIERVRVSVPGPITAPVAAPGER